MALRLLAACALLSTGGAVFAAEIDGPNVAAYFDAAFAIERREHELVGVVVSVVRNGDVLFEKGYGYADLEQRVAADPKQSLFRIASVTKTFTWTAVMQLVEQGKLDLDADIGTYIDFAIPPTFSEPIRMRHLMSHTAGFEDRLIGWAVREPEDLVPLGRYLASHIPARVRPPGEYSAYSNYGAALAGYVVERVAEMPWESYVEQHIFHPLGMASTNVRQPIPEALRTRMSVGYEFRDGKFVPRPFPIAELAPAGIIATTADDMARYMLAHLQLGRLGEARILEEPTARRMQSELFRHDPDVNPFLHGFYRSDRNGIAVFGHMGDIKEFHSELALFPEHQLGIFVSFNSQPGDAARDAVIAGFIDRFFPRELPVATAVKVGSLEDYVGEWASMQRNHASLEHVGLLLDNIRITRIDDGELRMVRQNRVSRWVPIAKDRFRGRYDDTRLVFHRDESGDVNAAFLSSFPLAGMERLTTIESPQLHRRLLVALVLIALVTVLGYDYRLHRPASTNSGIPRGCVWLGLGLGTLVFVELAAIVYGLTRYTEEFSYGIPALFVAIRWLGWLIFALAAFAAVLAVLNFARANGSLGARIRYTIVAVSGLVFGWQLWFWNLM